MSMYASQHPMQKQSSVGTVFSNVRNVASKYTNPAYLRNTVMQNLPEILSGAAGLSGGAYIGNQIYQNTIPPVRSLPRLAHEQLIDPYYQNQHIAPKVKG